MKQVLYLAKEPDNGVMSDLKSLKKHKVTVVACLPGYREYYQFLGYNTITADQYFSLEDMKFDVIIGNPPYGKNSSLAVKFLNKSSEVSDFVMMVLPRSFRKPSIMNRVNQEMILMKDETVDDDAFRDSIVTCVQTWKRTGETRDLIETRTEHPDFAFTTKEQAELCLGRVGGGPTGKVFEEWENRSPKRTFSNPEPPRWRQAMSCTVRARCWSTPPERG